LDWTLWSSLTKPEVFAACKKSFYVSISKHSQKANCGSFHHIRFDPMETPEIVEIEQIKVHCLE
jgi:hypothetical protein